MKKLGIAAGIVVVLGVALALLWFKGRPMYRHHRELRAVQQAQAFMAKEDYRNASISARQALALNPNNVQASMVIAQLCELQRAPQALDWRQKIAEISPTVENKLLLASTALRLQGPPYPLVVQTLEELSQATNNAGFQVVSAELALKLNRLSEAEACFEKASQLEPTNSLHRLNLAVLRLRSTNEVASAQARDALKGFATNSALAPVALRWLVADRLVHKDYPAAVGWSWQLLANPQCNLDDRLQHLTLLRNSDSREFAGFLGAVQAIASTNAGAIYGVSAWMLSQSMTNEAIAFLSNCPVRLQEEQPVPLAKVDYYVAIKDFAGLEQYLLDKKWGDLEFMRQAFLARAAQQQKDALGAEARWRLAVRQAADRLGPLTSLLSMATAWEKEEDRRGVLLQIVQRFPKEHWAARELGRAYTVSGDTQGLNKLYGLLVANDPKDWVALNNFAATSMLLQMNLPKAHEAARELYLQHTNQPVIASTYAWSLCLQGKTNEALSTMRRLSPEALKDPAVALYYGVLLSYAAQTNEALRYIEIGTSAQLLPEEKDLAAQVRRGL